jgi:hypothetical protein
MSETGRIYFMDGLSSPVQNRSISDTTQPPANHSPAKPQGMVGGMPIFCGQETEGD